MRAGAAALLALVATLVTAVPAEAATRQQVQAAAFAVPTPTSPVRDVVIEHAPPLSRTAVGRLGRYQVNDGAGNSVEITKSTTCSISCTGANEQVIADFLGKLPHSVEMNLLTVNLVHPSEMGLPVLQGGCGVPPPGSQPAQACYFPSQNRMVISGNDGVEDDGATRQFVIAHEYGHHLANHRENPPFDIPAIDWGPKNWASFARVCQGVRAGRFFPGDEGDHYFQNPGEAFAESFAHNAFPNDPVPWHWTDFAEPHTGAFAPIQRDALDPWNGPEADKRGGLFGKKRPRRKKTQKTFETPNDGDFTLKLNGPDRADLALKLKGPDGGILQRSDGVGSQEQVSYRICGERKLTAVVRRRGSRKTRFKLTALRP